jgi:diguanylate cyclase (GGDEF)-like protein
MVMAKMKILVVEDESIIAMDIAATLKQLGYEVMAIVPSGEQAISKVEEDKPDLVLMDITLKGGMDGIETAEQMRSRFKIPVVYLTGSADEKTLERAKLTGPYGYIMKPFEEADLRVTIEIGLHRAKMEEEHKRKENNIDERVKELSCLYGIARIVERPDITLDEVSQEVVNLLPASWQYPEITCARITINGRKFEVENYRDTDWKQSSDIEVYGAKAGILEISYLEERPEVDEGPFLKEERALIDSVCRQLGRIIEYKQMEENMRQLAYFDEMTGLPNRTLFNDRLNVALARAKRNKEKLAVMMLDLDEFKIVNDTLGHKAGDRLLQVVGDRLKGALRESDTVSRIGGDEFMILLPSITYEKSVVDIAQKILCAFREPFRVGDHELHVTTSVGISLYPKDGTDSDTLIKNADAAVYRSKAKGGNTSQQFGLDTSY